VERGPGDVPGDVPGDAGVPPGDAGGPGETRAGAVLLFPKKRAPARRATSHSRSAAAGTVSKSPPANKPQRWLMDIALRE
jgi:hypothetical protein